MPAEGASDAINYSGDMIEVVLVRPADSPRVIMIRWPNAPTITTPARYNEVASTAMRLLAEASAAIAPPPESQKPYSMHRAENRAINRSVSAATVTGAG